MILGPGIPGLSNDPSASRGGCPACGRPDAVSRFNWRLSAEDPQGEFHPYTRTLQEQKKLKRGSLFKCPSCGHKWWLDEAGEMMRRVPRDRLLLLERWSSIFLALSPDLMRKAAAIGATPPHTLSSDRDFCQVPCRVVTRDGDLDKCLLVFQAAPPLGELGKPPRLLDEVLDLAPSDFALPHAVRVATSRSQATPKGTAPTPIRCGKGSLRLNWVVNFLDRPGMRGCEAGMTPGRKGLKGGGRSLVAEPLEAVTFFFGDWHEDLRGLLPKG